MAPVYTLRTSGLFLLLFLRINACASSPPWIFSARVVDNTCDYKKCVFELDVKGDFNVWSLTYNPVGCGPLLTPESSTYEVPTESFVRNLYFCAEKDGKWAHQGQDLYLAYDDVTGRVDLVPRQEPKGDTDFTASNDKATSQLQNDLRVNSNNRNFESDLSVETFSYIPQSNILLFDTNELEAMSQAAPRRDTDDILLHGDAKAISQGGMNDDITFVNTNDLELLSRRKRQSEAVETTQAPAVNTTDEIAKNETSEAGNSLGAKTPEPVAIDTNTVKLLGLRVEEADKEPKIVDGIPSVLRQTKFTLRLFGEGFTNDTVIAFTHMPQSFGKECTHLLDEEEYNLQSASSDSAVLELLAPLPDKDYKFYICTKANRNSNIFFHQGPEQWKILATHNKLLPLWVSLILIVVLLMLASLFSGLNLGLMALDRTELRIIANTGTETERKYARAIMPVRAHGNYLLCTILLSNVAVNSTFTVILDDLTSGLVAVIGSTLAIVFIAEITPQAVCARHGLLVGAKSIWIMKIVMGICAPLAWPTSKLLDYFLGEEIGTHYNRERLKELVKVTNHVNDLDKEEVNIISGALDLRKKTVKDVMTKLKDCFMLPITSVLDFETMSEIVKSGYSRIPVFEGHRGNIVTVLFIKDLAFVDPDDNTPLRTLCQYYQNQCNFVFEDATLDVMLKQFKEGHKGHMAFVQRIDHEGDGDPVYETVGLVTLEDVIEEMIQAEIVDETDVFSDNRTKRRLARPVNRLPDISVFAGHQHQRIRVSPQLVLATFQFLTASVDAFRPELISETVLRRLLKQDVLQHIKLRGDEGKDDPKRYVYQEGKPVDYFVLILEGRVEVTVGRENLVFEAGPFTYFGVQALTQNVGLAESPAPSTLGSLQNLNMDSMLRHTFVPDYSVKAIAELCYLTIKRSMYMAAKRATLMEKGALNKGGTNEQIEPEVDKLLREGESDKLDDVKEDDKTKLLLPTSASPLTNVTFDNDVAGNPEEEKLLNKQ